MKHRIRAAAASILVLGAMLLAASCNPLTGALQAWSTFELVMVDGGTMDLGDVDMVWDASEQPPYTVQMSSFLMSRFEITQGLFEQIMGYNPSYFTPGQGYAHDPTLPVERVTWLEAVKFCNALSDARGLQACYTIDESVAGSETVQCDFTSNGFRLPTEAEWEYAARGGPWGTGYLYPGSDTLNTVAWSGDNPDTADTTHPVGSLAGNDLGLYDMAGNVWEYVWDGWAPAPPAGDYSFYWSAPYNWDGTTPISNPHGPFVLNNDKVWLDDYFVLRGGGFTTTGGWYERVSARTYIYNAGAVFDPPTVYWSYDTGFRVVRRP